VTRAFLGDNHIRLSEMETKKDYAKEFSHLFRGLQKGMSPS